MMNESLKIILIGAGIVCYLVAYGVNYPLAMYGVIEMYESGIIDETGFNLFKYGYIVVGMAGMIVIVLYAAVTIGKKQLCSKCNEVLNK